MSRLSFIGYLPSVETIQPLEAELFEVFGVGFEEIQDCFVEILHGFALGIIRRFRGKERFFVQEDHSAEGVCGFLTELSRNRVIKRKHRASVSVEAEGGQQLRRVGEQAGSGLGIVRIFKGFLPVFEDDMVVNEDKQNEQEQNSRYE